MLPWPSLRLFADVPRAPRGTPNHRRSRPREPADRGQRGCRLAFVERPVMQVARIMRLHRADVLSRSRIRPQARGDVLHVPLCPLGVEARRARHGGEQQLAQIGGGPAPAPGSGRRRCGRGALHTRSIVQREALGQPHVNRQLGEAEQPRDLEQAGLPLVRRDDQIERREEGVQVAVAQRMAAATAGLVARVHVDKVEAWDSRARRDEHGEFDPAEKPVGARPGLPREAGRIVLRRAELQRIVAQRALKGVLPLRPVAVGRAELRDWLAQHRG
mmetsp:Transcript_13377/g.34345  ORF Transcript_13377/g.34345 Transcript_13377/m.34345 type:complete len:273 (-) Transcript_13377:589-1407(-)